ncbi:hypothetical protein Hanom_Chr14g01275701 [Helianthus anomalus]
MRIGGVRGSKNHLPITNGESVIRFGLAVNPNCRFIVSILFWWFFVVVVVDDRRHMWDVVVMVDTLRWWWWWTVVICRVGSRGARLWWWGVEVNVGWRWGDDDAMKVHHLVVHCDVRVVHSFGCY